MANSNPYLILTRVRNAVILELREIFAPRHNTAVVPPFEYNYLETASSATLQFYGNPLNLDTITIGTLLLPQIITFVTAAPTGFQVQIGPTPQITLANLVALINANSSTLLVGATTNSIPNVLKLTATFEGASGNLILLSTTSTVLRFSAGNLLNGGLFDFDNSEVFISDAVPQDYQDWPCIVVNTAAANETRYLGPEDSFQAKNASNVVNKDEIFTSLVVNVDIKVYVIDDTLARDKIIDLIYNNMSEIRHQLAVNGIEMIDRTLPNETRIAQNQRIYIENHLILRVYCEWSDSTAIQNVTGVSVTVPVYTATPPVINSPLSASYSIADNTLAFTIDSIDDSTHLTVGSTIGFASGYNISQSSHNTNIISIIPVDMTHVQLEVASTSGFVTGSANMIIPFNYQITASNDPTSYSAVGLPIGIDPIDASNGLITGIPTATGTSYVLLGAINASGTGTQSLTITIS